MENSKVVKDIFLAVDSMSGKDICVVAVDSMSGKGICVVEGSRGHPSYT